jgi:hypothetical protein
MISMQKVGSGNFPLRRRKALRGSFCALQTLAAHLSARNVAAGKYLARTAPARD